MFPLCVEKLDALYFSAHRYVGREAFERFDPFPLALTELLVFRRDRVDREDANHPEFEILHAGVAVSRFEINIRNIDINVLSANRILADGCNLFQFVKQMKKFLFQFCNFFFRD